MLERNNNYGKWWCSRRATYRWTPKVNKRCHPSGQKVYNLTMRTVVFQQKRASFTRTSFENFCYATECIFYFCGLRQLWYFCGLDSCDIATQIHELHIETPWCPLIDSNWLENTCKTSRITNDMPWTLVNGSEHFCNISISGLKLSCNLTPNYYISALSV